MKYIIFYVDNKCAMLKIKSMNHVDGYKIETKDSPLYYGIAEKGKIYTIKNCIIECRYKSVEDLITEMVNNYNGIIINQKEYEEIEEIILWLQSHFKFDDVEFWETPNEEFDMLLTVCKKEKQGSYIGNYFIKERIYDELESMLTNDVMNTLNRIAGYEKYSWFKINANIDHKRLFEEAYYKEQFGW